MDLLYGSDHKFNDLDEDMNELLDNDVFQSPSTTDSGPSYNMNDDWFDSFFVDPVLNDKMITDAAQPPHIKCEHSYSTMNDNSLSSSDELGDIGKIEDLESDLLIRNGALDLSMKTTSALKDIKQESLGHHDPLILTTTATPTVLTRTITVPKQQPTIILASSQGHSMLSERSFLSKFTVKTEPQDTSDNEVNVDTLPPTPPSSNNSDSDSCPSPHRSAPSSPVRHFPYSRPTDRGSSSYSSSSLSPTGSTRSYSSHSYYSSSQSETVDIVFQQIPTSGVLVLTEEEKRTLVSEGYPIPSKLPLTKQEEKNLKKIRRKIKNKISAQESRRKKKEYLEALEKRVESFSHENSELKKKVDTLENNNRSLMSQLQKLQSLVGKIPRPNGAVPQTGLMVLVLCFAVFMGSWSPSSLNVGYGVPKPNGLPVNMPFANPQLVKPAPLMGPHLAGAKVDAYCTPPMKSRVLMSLRGEQDDLNWYDIYGPSVPYAELDKETDPLQDLAHSAEYAPKASAIMASVVNDDDKLTHQEAEKVIEPSRIETAQVMSATKSVVNGEIIEVTVDGRFGHANTSRDEVLKSRVRVGDVAGELKMEGIVESADNI
ncbi:cyclic AMP-responsive element-binding protein 3-like protein 1 isoform X1 [Dreissena polymorpha]|nr:cyclic AMP-responsive element-binding protein 3-like protein 1 isoform X1 [Dreissena polymorpha]